MNEISVRVLNLNLGQIDADRSKYYKVDLITHWPWTEPSFGEAKMELSPTEVYSVKVCVDVGFMYPKEGVPWYSQEIHFKNLGVEVIIDAGYAPADQRYFLIIHLRSKSLMDAKKAFDELLNEWKLASVRSTRKTAG